MAASWQPLAEPACVQALGTESSRLVLSSLPGGPTDTCLGAGVDSGLSPVLYPQVGGLGSLLWSGRPAGLASPCWQVPSVRAGTPEGGLIPTAGPGPSSVPLLHPFLLQ